jgi:hypothetical protein
MSYITTLHNKNDRHYTTVSRSITIDVMPNTVWCKISNIVGLTDWVLDVKKTEFLSKTRHGVGAIRRLTFLDGTQVTEYVVGWQPEAYFSYIATSGLPLDAYHATLSVHPRGKSTQLVWTTFLISDSSDKKQFEEFLSFIEKFYEVSLQNLKAKLERTHPP